MTGSNKKFSKLLGKSIENNSLDNTKILADITRRDIERSIKIDNKNGTEAYYSNRYGWTLRKIIY